MKDEVQISPPTSAETLVTGRRTILKWSGVAIVGALAISGKLPGLDMAKAFAQAGGAMTGKAVDLGEGDVGILNYAYALEQATPRLRRRHMPTWNPLIAPF